MKLLALETSTEACSAALWVDGQICVRFQHAPRLQTELLLPMIEEVLAEAAIQLGQLDGLAYSRGPGAFTGVRIAAAAVQAIAYARDLPVLPVSSVSHKLSSLAISTLIAGKLRSRPCLISRFATLFISTAACAS